MRHERSMLPERYGMNEDDIVDKLNVFQHRGPSKPCQSRRPFRSSFVEARRSWVDRASSKLKLGRSSLVEARRGLVDRASPEFVEAGSLKPRRRSSRSGRSSLMEARRSWVDRASSMLVEAGSIEPRRSSSRLGRSSLVEAGRSCVDAARTLRHERR